MTTFPPSSLSVENLTFHDQFVLWATRHWVTTSTQRPTMPRLVGQAFAVAGAIDAADDLHTLLTIITTAAVRVIRFRPVGCPIVSPDEARFLTLMTAARCETSDADTLILFREWLPAAAACQALLPARRFAWKIFDKVGSPSVPHAHAWQMECIAGTHSPDPGYALTH